MLPGMAARNLGRNRRRTLLSLLVVAAGTASLVLTAGFIRFSFDGLEDAIVRGGLGHLEILPAAEAAQASRSERVGPPSLDGWAATRLAVESVSGVKAAAGIVRVGGLVSKGSDSLPFVGIGVEPDRERRMEFDLRIRDGTDLEGAPPAEGQETVVLGSLLAEALGARPGDSVTLMAVTSRGTLNAVDMTVRGTFTSGLRELDARLLRMNLETAQRLLETEKVSSILATVAPSASLARTKAEVKAEVAGPASGLAVLDWRERAPFYSQVRSLYSGIFFFLGTIIVVLVGLSTSNTLLMSVMERVREIGTLLALGTSRAQIAALILLEAVWLGVLGGAAGALLGLGVSSLLDAARVEMPPPPGAVDPIPLHLKLLPGDMVLAAALMVLVLAAASLLPLARTARLRIVDALGHV